MEYRFIGGGKYWFVSMVFVEPLVSTKRVANWIHIVCTNFHCRHLVKNACAHDTKNANINKNICIVLNKFTLHVRVFLPRTPTKTFYTTICSRSL